MITIRDIAKEAGVSPATVSNVLNGKRNVGEETRNRIIEVCSQLGYKQTNYSRKEHSLRTVIFNFSDFDRSFYLHIINGISECLTENNYDLIICTNKSCQNFMKRRFSAGAISLDGKITDKQLLNVAAEDYPIIVMDRIVEDSLIKSVIVDNYPIMCELIQELVNKGYERFGYLGGTEGSLDNTERYAGFFDTLMMNKIDFNKKFYFHGDYREKSGYQAARLMLMSNSIPQILVCANDNMAIGAIKAFRENGITIPEDVAVTGFDDSDTSVIIGLTTVSIPRFENGYLAAKELVEMLNGKPAEKILRINASIKWRTST